MEQYLAGGGMQYLAGAGDVDAMLREMGLDPQSVVGQNAREALLRRFGPVGGERARNWPLLFTPAVAVADGAAGTPTSSPDRDGFVQGFFVEGNDATGTLVAGISLSALTVNGHNAVVGAGAFPCRLGFGEFAQSAMGDSQWYLGLVKQGGTVVATVDNESGAAADIYAGARILTTD